MKTLAWGKLGALVLISFTVHTTLLVNSVETELQREQALEGQLLSGQLADGAAQPTMAHDMVSLSVLTSGFQDRPNIAAIRVLDSKDSTLAEYDSDTAIPGSSFSAPITLQGQALGRAEVQLAAISRGEILRHSRGNIGVSAGFHLGIFILALMIALRARASAQAAMPAPVPLAAAPEPAPPPKPLKPVALLQLNISDPNNLLMRVNATTADELLTVFDHLLDRAARLYGGQVAAPFSPAGTLVVFSEADPVERAFKAMVCGQLFLALAAGADVQRRAAGLFSLPVKAGLHHAADDLPAERQIANTIAQTAPSGKLLCSTEQIDPEALDRCQPGQSLKLALGAGRELPIVVIERLHAEFQQLVHNQTQQLLGLNAAGLAKGEAKVEA
jgi:hypothetical protein